VKVTFAESDRQKVLAAIKTAMGDRKLGEMVKFEMDAGAMNVVINKLGKSVISFKEKTLPSGLEYTLAGEKIALTHRAFKDEVQQKIMSVIEKAGGKVQA
jgi:hypothetical protein